MPPLNALCLERVQTSQHRTSSHVPERSLVMWETNLGGEKGMVAGQRKLVGANPTSAPERHKSSGQVAFLGGKSRSLGIHDQMCHHLKYSKSFEDFPVTGTKLVPGGKVPRRF